ncbi:HetP family heterocyst commitment protein [Oscillatoria acuminata]|uniref:Heterocyst differentiation protein n=1 Tax=Oscillatoria acuminata PCC 6304 TaxID=56110 RepID=K9TCY3_9CYAN|nr:HetP family heterocyst commitment protein [Oscillatoria acuminata]AFY79854.1 hypothetical protein Oscil6304_0096 [Oscillatoria acuminata PCC 6304]
MTYQMHYSNRNLDKIMTQEQFELVVDAILAGKYSWACVLILRFGGYNPLHYIPYRTYNRLMKQQRQGRQESGHRTKDDYSDQEQDKGNNSQDGNHKIKDLTYLEVVEHQSHQVTGGSTALYASESTALGNVISFQ